ncbi:fatty acid desaturase [Crocinitomix catalasitica]|uniref:fatty acid desaturase n=1 Tax=Crocinitomix catalasitica TaxID=184607 RepID=UPI00048929AC|nr:fatty acid desaturase [Crocinitomix catalasitica]
MDAQSKIITVLRSFEVSDNQKSLFLSVFTILALLFSVALACVAYSYNPLFALVLSLPTAILLCRFFVLQHDAGHLSLFTKRSYNKTAGLIFGFMTMIPSRLWNHIHNTHHGILGNLEKRKINPELWTLTITEYENTSRSKRILYHFVRSIFMRLFITPAIWVLAPRIPLPHLGQQIFIATIVHNLIYGIVFYFLWINNLMFAFLIIYLIPLYLFNFIAAIFFYLQHQYEGTFWENEAEWDLYNASIHGSSHLVTGRFWSWVSGNVGCHHIHHLNTRIPSYKLYSATNEANKHLDIEPIYLNQLFHHLRCVLWDEDRKKLISFREYRKLKKASVPV